MKMPFVTPWPVERLDGLTVDWTVRCVAFRLHEDLVQPELVLIDATVNALVIAPTQVLGGVGSCAAIAHRNEDVQHQLLKEGGRLVQDRLQKAAFEVDIEGSDRSIQGFLWSHCLSGRRGRLLLISTAPRVVPVRQRLEVLDRQLVGVLLQKRSAAIGDAVGPGRNLVDEAGLGQKRHGPTRAILDVRGLAARYPFGSLVGGKLEMIDERLDH